MRILENLGIPGRSKNSSKAYSQDLSDQVTMKMKILSFCHSSRASSPLPGFMVFFLICYVHKMESATFTVIGSRGPITAILGQEAVLPCHLSPRMSAANMEVKWFRSKFVSIVHLYHNGKDQYERQIPEYWGRTELLKAGLTDGNIPLRILNIRLSDEGQYHCFVQDDIFYEETIVELQVADPFFPRVNSWMAALGVILVVLIGFIVLTVYLFKMKDQATMMGKVPSFSPGSTVSSALPGYIALCLTLQVHRLVSGGEAILPCHLSPRMSAENMEVRWFRSQFSAVVHLYHDGQDQYGQQMPEYRERTELLRDDITNGRVSLRIRDIRPSDNGQYKCFFQSSVSYEDAILELQVAGQ
nr:myelin-oligodendrocyte glycoprotein-like [Chrysemys picta bellii]